MPIDSSIPLQFRPAPIDALGAYEQGQRISQNALTTEQMGRTNELQKVLYHDQMLARAAQMGANSPEEWDQAFGELSRTIPDARQFVGQWAPDAAQRLSGRLQGNQQRMGGQIGLRSGGGIDAAAGGDEAAMVQPGKPGMPTGAGINMTAMPPERAYEGYTKLTNAVQMLSRPGAIQNGEQYRQALIALEKEFPRIHDLVRQKDAAGTFQNPLWADDLKQMTRNFQTYAEQLKPLAGAVATGLPVQEPKPGYQATMSEAGPVLQTNPYDGSKPTFEFAPLSGEPDPSFLPQPKAGEGGQDLTYGEDGKLNIDPDTRKRLQYAVDYFRKWQKMPPMGMGKGATLDRKIILALAGEQSGAGGVTADIQAWADRRASTMSLGQLRKFADMTQSYEDLMLENIKALEQRMPEGIAGAWPWLNQWVQSGRTSFGDPNVPAYTGALVTVLNEYAKILSGATGAAGITDSAREEAMQYLSRDMNAQQVRNALALIKQDAHNRRFTLDNKINQVIERVGYTGKPTATPGGSETHADEKPPKTKPSWAP